MKMPCENARSLVPSYLDGELSEEQAVPLREHLYACRDCREVAKQEKNLKAWFVDQEVVIPPGFAGEVARRAFAGARPALEGVAGAITHVEEPGRERAGTLLPFVLKLSTLAAGVLLTFAVAIQRQSLPAGDGLDAQSYRPPWEKEPASELVEPTPASNAALPSDERDASADDDPSETPGEPR